MFEFMITIGICVIFGLFINVCEKFKWIDEFGEFLGI